MAAAIAILDSSYNCLISRSYKSTILSIEDIFKNFGELIEINDQKPIFQFDEINYIFIKNNEITICVISISDQVNVMMLLSFLYRFNDVLMDYFKVKSLNKDLIIDNFNLIYDLFDEMMDFGMPQLTEASILKDVIKVDANLSTETQKDNDNNDEDLSKEINSSILRSTTQQISWRPRGIFYKKNEFFLNVVEKVELIFDFKLNKLIKFKINGNFNVNCYLSGMPILKIGLNKLNNVEFKKSLKFHQCVDLIKFNNENIIEFIPPDGTFKLLNYSLDFTKKKINPLLQILELDHNLIELNSENYLRLKFKIKTNFSKNSSLSKLLIKIPILNQYLSKIDLNSTPKFKTNIGKVFYKFDDDCIIWSLNSEAFGDREFSMQSQFKLTNEKKEEVELSMDPPPKQTKPNFEKIKNIIENDDESIHNDKNIKFEFELPDFIISGLKVEYLKILEDGLNYTSFPWIKYISTNDDDYIYRV